jgi:hypothetical protein
MLRRDPYRPASVDSVDQLARELAILRRSARRPQLSHSAIDDGALVTTVAGQTTTIIGQQFDGTSGAVVVAGPTPPTPSAPGVTTQPNGITVRWDGTFPDQAGYQLPVVAPQDFKGVEVQVSPDPAFPQGDTAQAFDLVVGTLITSARGGDVFVPWGSSGTPLYARLVTRAVSGKGSLPSAVTGPVSSGTSDDNVAPKAPSNLDLTSNTSMGKDGHEVGYIAATWLAPTLNVDDSAIYDLAGYLVQWKLTARTDWQSTITTNVSINLSAAPNQSHQVRVAAFDRANNFSPWSATATITVTADLVPPATPSVPVVNNYLGQLRIFWDGLLAGGTAPPADFSRVDVHVSGTSGFTPVAGTRVSSLATRGYAFATSPYGVDAYVKLVAYDNSGNASTASAQAVGATSQVVGADVLAGAVGTLQLADLAVVNAKIGLLAVNDANIGNLNVGKLVTGTLTANIVNAGRFATALAGARTELNALGFQKFRADGSKAVSITDLETLLSGLYKTAETGRRIEMGVSGAMGQISFISPSNITAFVKGYTEPNAMDSIQVGIDQKDVPSPHFLYGRTNWNEDGNINTHGKALIQGFTQHWRVENYTNTSTYNADDPPSTGSIYRLLIDNNIFAYRDSANRLRMYMDNSTTALFGYDGIQFMDRPSGLQRLIRFTPDGTSPFQGSLEISHNAGQSQQSARMALVQADLGGTILKSWHSGFEARDLTDVAFRDIRALGFVTMSDERRKTAVADSTLNGCAAVAAMRVRQYKVQRPKWNAGKETEEVDQIGLVAQEAQAAGIPIVAAAASDSTLGIDLYQYVTVLAKSLQELLGRVDALEKKGKP